MIWATVSSQSCFCWLYRASPSLAAKNIICLISVLTIWWCPCIESSLVLLEEGVCNDQCVLLAKQHMSNQWPLLVLLSHWSVPKWAPPPPPLVYKRSPNLNCGKMVFWDTRLPSSQSANFLIKIIIPCSNNSSPNLLTCQCSQENALRLG